MTAASRLPLIVLGWQTWSVVAVVVALILAAAAYVMFG